MRYTLLFTLTFLLHFKQVQATPSDSLSFLQKIFHSRNTGVLWRFQTGFLYSNQFHRGGPLAAAVPVAAEISYKFRFMELGYRRQFGGFPLGMDQPVRINANDPGIEISQTVLTAMRAHELIGTLHFTLMHIPLFFRAGIGPWQLGRTSTDLTFASGKTGHSSLPPASAKGRMLGLGFAQGYFYASLEYHFLKWEQQNFIEYPGKTISLSLGCQFAPPGGHALDNRLVDFEERLYRISFGAGRRVLAAPWNKRAAASALYFEAVVRILPKWCVALGLHPSPDSHGYDKESVEFVRAYGPKAPSVALYNSTLENCQYWQLRTDYTFDPFRNFKWVLSAGAGKYQIFQVGGYSFQNGIKVEPDIQKHKTFGLVLGGGFDFRAFQSRMMFHNPLLAFPAFFEWSIGFKLSFLKMRG